MILLFHATSWNRLASIAANGLNPGSYWSCDWALYAYYQQTVEDKGREPLGLVVGLDKLNPDEIRPDLPGIEEPVSLVLGLSKNDVRERWENSGKTWRDSIELIGSVRYRATVAASRLRVMVDDETYVPLLEYVANYGLIQTPEASEAECESCTLQC